ncbi:MAG: hypothetical protein WC358_01770 [Ignavibacteria bacterium]|jgi:hypothetical protein
MKNFILLLIIISTVFISIKSNAQKTNNNSSIPTIDGKINDEEWKGAKVFKDFYIIVPKTDEKYYDSTIVYLKQSNDALYFGFKFWPKGKVISKSFSRDRSTDEENEFFILLDLENKHQNGYYFSFSFLNNQRDAIVYNVKNMSDEWDWVWECKSIIHSEAKDDKPGYIESEVKIPVDKLQNKNQKQIGIDVQLFAYKPDGTQYFYSIVPNSELLTLKGTYKLDITPFDEKINLKFDIMPFVVSNKSNGKEIQAIFGGDVNTTLDKHKLKLTYNTDQSTLEADPYTFTFYNRPIFLSEKRPFFSKDLDIYNTPISLFYTRSIDSIKYGGHYTYRSDKFKAGTMFVREPKDSTFKDYFVTRPNFNFKDFNLGGMFIYTNDGRINVSEQIVSVDGFYRMPSTRLRFMGQFASNIGSDKKGQAFQFYNYYEYNQSGGPYYDLSYNRVNKDFQSSTSFNSQIGSPNDYEEISVSGGYQWNINRKYFSYINANGGYYLGKQITSQFKYQEKVYGEINYKINDVLSFYHYIEYNRPDDNGANGNIIKKDNFDFDNNIKILLGSNAFIAGYECGPYFGGFIKHPYASADMVFFDKVNLQFIYHYRDVLEIKQNIYRLKLNYQIFPKLYLRSFFQEDTYNKMALWNTLLQYEFFAGSNVYLVFNLEGEKLQNTIRYFKIGYNFNL